MLANGWQDEVYKSIKSLKIKGLKIEVSNLLEQINFKKVH